ncbi:MAG TPA: hypothetical protein VG099_29220 [Gemmataceae bacterium]|jgi:transcription antitermination factor NusA-like protein|nr:hypothetical protein [Gemmataceae bacterium]
MMSREESMRIIRETFAHADVERFDVEYDAFAGAEVVKVYVRADQLEAALGDNGSTARRAAMKSGMHIEVMLSGE